MIPDFTKDGNLPAGIHTATINEINDRYAYNNVRRRHFEHLLLLIEDLRKIGCRNIFLDGSYITNKVLPGDMDICWDETDVDLDNAFFILPILWKMDFPRIEQQQIYHADIFPATLIESETQKLFIDFFQKDKTTNALKGIIKIEL